MAVHCKAYDALPIRFACRISEHVASALSKPSSDRFTFGFASSRKEDGGAFGNEQLSSPFADPTGCASHDCHFVVEHSHLITY